MNRHKIVLYNPDAVFYTMPLALMAIGSALDTARFEVRIVDGRLQRDPVATVLRECEDALCFGVTVLTGQPLSDALRVTRVVKAQYPSLPTIWGGWHPSLFPADTLAEPTIDVTVQGQGEVTFAEIVERLADGGALEGIWGTASRVGGEPTQNPPRPLVGMNDLPAHDYTLIPVERYYRLKEQRQLDYISSTGCHFRCAFCADPFVYNRKWVGLDPERMGEEIAHLWHRYRFEDLAFQDETFFTYKKRVVSIAEEFLRRGLKFTWTGTLRADQGFRLSDEVLELCARSGLRRVMIGVESGSQEMLDWMSKDVTIEQILDSAEKCVRHGIGAIFPFIVGFPGETEESIQATVALVKQLRAMSPTFETPIFYFKPYPGSRITEEVVRQGYQLPRTLEEWAHFDYIGSSGPWVTPDTYELIERFKFYNRFAWGPETWLRWPLQKIARWRCKRDFYTVPVEKVVVERLKPLPRLS
ncbi:MAG: B12-binding domain-containing radical SAM protein [Chloroflexota bacterium]|nr:B12-binding domain-containing radical SAM protein [Chloroflexota bacterium]